MDKYIIISIGHTAAGKTTLLRRLSTVFNLSFISEGALKRSLVEKYENSCSVDEDLRSNGYKLALQKAMTILKSENTVILDASFHKKFRRMWVYEYLNQFNLYSNAHILWIYCYCSNRDVVKSRIHLREISKIKNADNQADKMFIYDYIIKEFDPVSINDFPLDSKSSVLVIDSYINEIISYTSNDKQEFFEDIVAYIKNEYLPSQKSTQ